MKHAQSYILNTNSLKIGNSFSKTGFSTKNKKNLSTKKFNASTTSFRFPIILLRTKNRNFRLQKAQTQSEHLYSTNNKTKKAFKDSFQILHYSVNEDNKNITTNRILQDTTINKRNLKEIDMSKTYKPISFLYDNYNEIIKNKTNNIFNYYDSIFMMQTKKTDYRKDLSSDFVKDNRVVINSLSTKFKQKHDSILNVLHNNEGYYYIKGLEYKKYLFYPHKKQNILNFHQNLMAKNFDIFQEKRRLENLKNNQGKKSPIHNSSLNNIRSDNILNKNIIPKKKKRHMSINYFLRKKMNQKIEEIINDEMNKVLNAHSTFN